MTNPAAVLDRVVNDLDQMLGADALMSLTDAERGVVLSVAGEVMRRVEATIIETVATGDPVDLPNGAGCRNVNELLQRTLRVDSRGAARIVKAGKVVHRDVDLTSGGVAAGAVARSSTGDARRCRRNRWTAGGHGADRVGRRPDRCR
ncbi:hypothetical protein [Microbacterium esteraromaticum]|uniref:hypothetical protein n=1 Tax=Microbacterium esteraromaticum TaxID=57043 RepID=UPI001C93FA01|nr:hypothetical protein [Microbacterium esteraromaticum]MBY6062512.1 hypothetical protein [Microbacterium esteraromaticum]